MDHRDHHFHSRFDHSYVPPIIFALIMQTSGVHSLGNHVIPAFQTPEVCEGYEWRQPVQFTKSIAERLTITEKLVIRNR